MNKSIIVPGLGDDKRFLEIIVKDWKRKFDIEPIIYCFGWKDKNKSFEDKLNDFLRFIDLTYSPTSKLSLIGTSAGASACINAYVQRKDKIKKLINICGRLRKGNNVFPSLEFAAKNSKSFYESVLLCEKALEALNTIDLSKILTIRPIFDEIVPTSLVTVKNAKNERIFSVEHLISIACAMTIYSNKIISFLEN